MTVHFTLQGKGGFGKSMIAGFIAQYYIDKGQPPLGIDTDPVNATLKSMKALALFGAVKGSLTGVPPLKAGLQTAAIGALAAAAAYGVAGLVSPS